MKNFFLGTWAFYIFLLLLLPGSALARSLSVGVSGNDVAALQKQLITAGFLAAGNDSGYFGQLTLAAVKKFQCAQGVICSGSKVSGYGVAGPKTQAALANVTSVPVQPSAINDALTPAAKGSFEFSGWIPYWRTATGTADVLPHLSQLTSIMPFGYTMKSDGTLADTAKLSEEPWTSFIAAAKKAKVRVIPTVMWGNGDSIQRVLSNTQSRVSLENQIAAAVRKNGFDGIDIDFEAKQSATINHFSTFLKGLYQRMGDKWVYCTVEARMPLADRYAPGQTVPPDATVYANDYAAMNKYCDRVEIMAYDQGTVDDRLNAARAAPYAPVADPGWVEDVVRLAAQSIARNKIIVGVPTYGYEYKVTPLSDSTYQYDVLWPFNPRYATDIAAKLGITPARNSAGELGFSYNPALLDPPNPNSGESTHTQQPEASSTVTKNALSTNSGQNSPSGNAVGPFNYVSWSDASAIADKVALAKRLGVRGIAVFKFDGGEDPGVWNVLK